MKIIYKQQDDPGFFNLGIRDCYFKTLSTIKDSRIVTHKLHHHNCFEIHIVVQGSECYEVKGKHVDLQQRELLLLCPNTPHRVLQSDEQTQKYAICFQADVCLPEEWFKGLVPQRIWERICFVEEEAMQQKESTRQLIGNAVAEIAVTVLRLAGLQEKRSVLHGGEHTVLSMAKQYIADNIDSAPTVPEVAQYCAMSTKQLVRIFSADLGVTPGEYIKRQQIRRITELIDTTVLSLKEISEQMHFSSVYYFNAFFKKYVGIPPGEYRKMCSSQ